MSKTVITAQPGMPLIIITRDFDAPRDLVFRAYIDPELLVHWLGPRDLTMTVDRYDARDGGTWRYVQKDADGSEYGFHGVFHGTPSPGAIVRTFEFEGVPGHVMLETTTLEQRDGRTLMRSVSSFQSVEDRDGMIASGMERGVRDSGDRLDELLARQLAGVSTQRPASLDRLDVLVGRWEMEASFGSGYFGPGIPATTRRGGLTTFEWLPGRFFLTQRFVVDDPAAPSGIAIIGPGEKPETWSQHYYDSRGVVRVYQMSLADGILRIWRDAPGFWQRYTGALSGDGDTIDGAWEWSADGREWQHDFGLTYTRAGGAAHEG
jgi:uncharacterized protein YndB with AHSA1/START domain